MEIIISSASTTIAIIIAFFGGILWKYVDAYLQKKANNYATKQDIENITTKTKSIQTEFQKNLEKFSTDLQFKYKIYENQYINLYSKLYHCVCESEAKRYVYEQTKEEKIDFENVPIPAYKNENGVLVYKIVKLVDENIDSVSPDLLKIVCVLKIVKENLTKEDNNCKILELKKSAEKELIKIIVNDYCWLRKQLHILYDDKEVEKLNTGRFIADRF